jgi:hypothetical protein
MALGLSTRELSSEDYIGGARKLWLPSYYQSGMVLQRSPYRAVVHGRGSLGHLISLELYRNGMVTNIHARADETGRWKAELPPQDAGFSAILKIKDMYDNEEIEFSDVLFGDVIFC